MSALVVIGGGLAGSEAAWQAAERGIRVNLYEMRPNQPTGAHVGPYLAELVCSNSLGSNLPDRAPGGGVRISFPGEDGGFRRIHPVRLPEHETTFAMTVHKSQGSEWRRVLLILPDRDAPVLTRELIYTAVTRASDQVEIWGRPDMLRQAVARRIHRVSGLGDALRDPL